ncbi:MAG: SPASM domain-containing protein, partial [Desulfobacterales bacterium]|nr:SPASM domain-containing protein [Desulfobacterales bacterium]
YYLGNILKTPMIDLVGSEKQRRFAQDKKDSLPRYCRECEVLHICNGECPKNRFLKTPDGEPGLNYLCAGYKAFFKYADKPMRIMADLLRRNRPASEVMGILAREETDLKAKLAKTGRNDPCPCGSGKKVKKCHGR